MTANQATGRTLDRDQEDIGYFWKIMHKGSFDNGLIVSTES